MRRLHLFIAGAVALPGCMVVPPSPTYEAVSLMGNAVVNAASLTPSSASNVVTHSHQRIDRICIQFNPAVAVADFVPAVQSELHDLKVDSRVYEPGMQPADCPAILRYTAYLEWDQRMLDDNYSSYLSFAAITLRSNDGEVIASANYALSSSGLDKWQSTRSKIAATVKALLAEK